MAARRGMKYNRLGDTGLLVSELSLGSWVTFDMTGSAGTVGRGGAPAGEARAAAARAAYAIMKRGYEGGVNFFDNAEGYANGDAERIMGDAVRMGIEAGTWDRQDLVLTTKLFSGADNRAGSVLENRRGLSRKHIIEGLQASLRRMGLAYVDVAFCHRCDPIAPIEEVVRGFNNAIDRGLCFYWATSEWTAEQLLQAKAVADRLGLVGPCADQPEYHLLSRSRVEVEYAALYGRGARGGMGLGVTTWSPLAGGALTGKYGKGVPPGSRLANQQWQGLRPGYLKRAADAERLRPVAARLGCTMGQLALAWCIANPDVSTVIAGATAPAQVDEQLGALPFVDRLTPEVMAEIDAALGKEAVAAARRPRAAPGPAAQPGFRTGRLSAGALAKL